MQPPDPGSLVPLQLDGDEAWITRDRAWVWVPRATLDRLRLSEPTRPRMVRIHPSEFSEVEGPPTGTPMTEVDGTHAEADRTRDRRLQQAAVWIAASALLVAFASGTWLGLLLRPSAAFPYVEAEPEPFAVLARPDEIPTARSSKADRPAKPKAVDAANAMPEDGDRPRKDDAGRGAATSDDAPRGTEAPKEAGSPLSEPEDAATTQRSTIDALLARAERDPEGAAAEAKRLRADEPDNIDLRYAAAYAEFKAGRREAARDLYCGSRQRFRTDDQREFDSFLRQYKLACP
ncbi:MAG: hypothetical protein RLZZ383_2250 [Pseudomonadota bacterium]|jgi:hypothetical protein